MLFLAMDYMKVLLEYWVGLGKVLLDFRKNRGGLGNKRVGELDWIINPEEKKPVVSPTTGLPRAQ